ncbi:esterase/lipase family protein [Massilia endophytica]|uniref:esterase/lipase family protein n=1 Tax=Massilia endophytica TaxID=2899220 RepID=UPI001E40F0BA|nr:GPI inositol-deacylase [Massilia endophytica]UGQ46144.1 GPI inositol-deacylase [Massilia endophytica]
MPTQLPIFIEHGGRTTYGFFTPLEDKTPQRMMVPPRRVIPIVFLPGIMGSNLRMSAARQKQIEKTNNIAWRPDRTAEAIALMKASAGQRQLQLDPNQTEVDTYDPASSPTGSKETADERHYLSNIRLRMSSELPSVFLSDDPPGLGALAKTKEQKAMSRGWGEVYFSSYRDILETCEKYLNCNIKDDCWKTILDKDPRSWTSGAPTDMAPLTFDQLRRATKECFFPVHAMGYNWLQGNEVSARQLSKRIRALISYYKKGRFECEKVIIVTHSMGGLVARALVHPDFGNAASIILGMVHGVMPAMGAPAAYKRMRCGFEQGPLNMSLTARVLGDTGSKVTAVLGNSLGGLELLPSKAYGNGWLEIRCNGTLFDKFPKHGDPYKEIYKADGCWYGLLRSEWLNPGGDKKAGVERTKLMLDQACQFHETIRETYHDTSYAHYGADPSRPSWETVTWDLKHSFPGIDWHCLNIEDDDQQCQLTLLEANPPPNRPRMKGLAVLGASKGPGDETVPLRSAEHQLLSGKFKGIFRQTDYEHQSSYQNQRALRSTLYSIVRIAEQMKWESDAR